MNNIGVFLMMHDFHKAVNAIERSNKRRKEMTSINDSSYVHAGDLWE
jgi:hypothetical protein